MRPFTILGDIPIRKSEDDELYRSEFVDSLTEFIKELPSNHKNTVGICGPWGCGKTSIANLIKNNLNLNKEKHVVIDFDPWLFSDHTDLTRTFLLHLYKNICSSKVCS